MACFIPFNNRNLDISFFAFRPTVVLFGELIDALKQFSLCTETLGCVQSSLIQSIHGNMIIWYGAWLKKSCEDKESLIATLISMLLSSNVSTMAILIEHSFFDSYAGDTRDGGGAARFCTGDTVSMSVASLADGGGDAEAEGLSRGCAALFGSEFPRLEGVASGVCLRCQTKPAVAVFLVWKSLRCCYSWILSSDHRTSLLEPSSPPIPVDRKYDVFRVVYVGGGGGDSAGMFSAPPHGVLEQGGESKGQGQVLQN